MAKITIYNRELQFDDKFVAHYETFLGGTLQQMAEHYLFVSTGKDNTLELLEKMSDEELISAIISAANEELEMNGVPYDEK